MEIDRIYNEECKRIELEQTQLALFKYREMIELNKEYYEKSQKRIEDARKEEGRLF